MSVVLDGCRPMSGSRSLPRTIANGTHQSPRTMRSKVSRGRTAWKVEKIVELRPGRVTPSMRRMSRGSTVTALVRPRPATPVEVAIDALGASSSRSASGISR